MGNSEEKIFVEHRGETTIVTFMDAKILDQMYIQELQESLMVAVDKSHQKLILDFCNVTFMSSAVLGLLIRTHKRMCEKRGKLELCRIKPEIFEVFEIMKLTEVFTIIS